MTIFLELIGHLTPIDQVLIMHWRNCWIPTAS